MPRNGSIVFPPNRAFVDGHSFLKAPCSVSHVPFFTFLTIYTIDDIGKCAVNFEQGCLVLIYFHYVSTIRHSACGAAFVDASVYDVVGGNYFPVVSGMSKVDLC